jgi:hypothetical protein
MARLPQAFRDVQEVEDQDQELFGQVLSGHPLQ